MKRHRPYLVPLTPAVVGILDELRKLSGAGSRYVFPASTKTGVISENTMIYGLYRMGYHSRATIHGFRGTASTILNESNRFSKDWIEKQLSHDDDDTVRSAYNAAEWLDDRRAMMCWWSDYLERAANSAGTVG